MMIISVLMADFEVFMRSYMTQVRGLCSILSVSPAQCWVLPAWAFQGITLGVSNGGCLAN